MLRLFSVLLAIFALAGCSTMIDRATQDITIETPGTGGALCFLERPGFSGRVWAPKTIRITKSAGPMNVTCRAHGNREKTLVVEPEIPDSFMLNIGTGLIPGGAVDYFTGAMYEYPEKIVIDFTGMKPQRMPEPEYQRVLDENPELMDMEEFRPGRAALQRDRNYTPMALGKRRTDEELFSKSNLNAVHTGEQSVSLGEAGTPVPYEPETVASEPVAPPESATSAPVSIGSAAPVAKTTGGGSAAEQLTRKMNPQVFSGSGMMGGIPVIGSGGAGSGSSAGTPVDIRPAQ